MIDRQVQESRWKDMGRWEGSSEALENGWLGLWRLCTDIVLLEIRQFCVFVSLFLLAAAWGEAKGAPL